MSLLCHEVSVAENWGLFLLTRWILYSVQFKCILWLPKCSVQLDPSKGNFIKIISANACFYIYLSSYYKKFTFYVHLLDVRWSCISLALNFREKNQELWFERQIYKCQLFNLNFLLKGWSIYEFWLNSYGKNICLYSTSKFYFINMHFLYWFYSLFFKLVLF